MVSIQWKNIERPQYATIGSINTVSLSGTGGKSGGRGVRVYVGRRGRSKILEVILDVAMVEYTSISLALSSLVDERESIRRSWPYGQCFWQSWTEMTKSSDQGSMVLLVAVYFALAG